MKDLVKPYVELYGIEPLCNKVKDRAPILGSFVFPLCWRCCGLIGGSLSGYLIDLSNIGAIIKIGLGFSLLIPLVLDSLLQKILGVESTNFRRVVSGILFGIGLHAFYH